MGAYFADFFRKKGFEVLISDRKTKLSNRELAKKADVVIVSVPIENTEEIIREVAPLVKKSGLLMDLTSVKMGPMDELKKTKASYLGCHPLFGPTAKLEGQIVVLSPGRGKSWQKWLTQLLESAGAIVEVLPAKKHDQLMSYIQTLNHFADIAMTDTLRKSGIPIKEFIKYPSPVYMLELYMMGRILNQDARLYTSMQMHNKMNLKALQDFMRSCEQLLSNIEAGAKKENQKFFETNAKYLGDFKGCAMEESDRLIRYLKLPQKRKIFEAALNPKGCDIVVLGPRSTYSDMALQKYSKKAKAWYASSIAEAFELVSKGKIKEALVPVENSTTGSVRETLDELYEGKLFIEKMIAQPVQLCLIGRKKIPLKKIRTLYSHNQPLLQSRQFIKKKLSKTALIPVSSTTAALERLLAEGRDDGAALASPLAAKAYGLEVIEPSVEDDKANTTYFALIRKNKSPKATRASKRTSIAFHFKKDSPGSLNAILQAFAHAGINLSKIESRPNAKVRGEYVFYIDFEKNLNHPASKKVLDQIKDLVANLKVLGSY